MFKNSNNFLEEEENQNIFLEFIIKQKNLTQISLKDIKLNDSLCLKIMEKLKKLPGLKKLDLSGNTEKFSSVESFEKLCLMIDQIEDL